MHTCAQRMSRAISIDCDPSTCPCPPFAYFAAIAHRTLAVPFGLARGIALGLLDSERGVGGACAGGWWWVG